jgi:hypothetical protein
MCLVKQTFDPKGLLNPGKMFPTPRTCGERAGGELVRAEGSPYQAPRAFPELEVW